MLTVEFDAKIKDLVLNPEPEVIIKHNVYSSLLLFYISQKKKQCP